LEARWFAPFFVAAIVNLVRAPNRNNAQNSALSWNAASRQVLADSVTAAPAVKAGV
jgi:hypothetical protein